MTLTRRALLRNGGLAAFSLGLGPRFLDRAAAQVVSTGDGDGILVAIFLRGAVDSLMAVPPLGDERLFDHRPRLALRPSQLHELGQGFGLHPALAPLLPVWGTGELAVVQGVGSPDPTRSHFEAQDFMETAAPGRRGLETGWLNRLAERTGAGSPFRAVAISPHLPRSLTGPAPSLVVDDLARVELELAGEDDQNVEERLWSAWEGTRSQLLRGRALELRETLRVLEPREIELDRAQRAGLYPDTSLGRSLQQIAYLIRRRVGLRVAFAQSEGWDTHYAQGTTEGRFATLAGDLAASLAAFWSDLAGDRERVTVLTMTEFGRTVAENGSAGTDHGHASCSFVLGRGVDGGRVFGGLPPLDPDALFEGRDLPVTVDFRSLFANVAARVFRLSDTTGLFPGWTGEPLPVLW